jgi:hypothetical protein
VHRNGLFLLIFCLSGDDHDYCEYSHVVRDVDVPAHPPIQEISVKSISMAMGILRPGFQMLSLHPEAQTHASIPCDLPSRLHTLRSIYAPLIVISVLALLVSGMTRERRGPRTLPRYQEPRGERADASGSSFPMTGRGSDAGKLGTQGDSDSERESSSPLYTGRKTAGPAWNLSMCTSHLPQVCWSRRGTRRSGLVAGLARDVVGVAGWPVCVWIMLACWTFYLG